MSASSPVAMPTAVMPPMVSRLPKFSSRPKTALTPTNSTTSTSSAANANANPSPEMGQASTVNNGQSFNLSSRLSNGFYHHPGPTLGVKSHMAQANGKQNGFIRAPTNFTSKWRKENVEDGAADFEFKPGKKDTKKMASPFTGKTRSLNQSIATISSPKVVTPKTTQASTKSMLNCLAKKQNGASSLSKVSRPSLGQGWRSGSPLENQKQAAGRSHSSDSLGASQNVPLTESDKVRSRSLTQVQRQPSPSNPAVKSRAYSTNRAERKASNRTSCLPTAVIKKPLLPSYGSAATRQNGGAGFKMSRIFKETGPVRVTVQSEVRRKQRRDSVETPSTDNSPGSSPEAPDSRGLSSERGSQNEVSLLGETLEDMSLSSTSSLDQHDTSQEYMDDFDNLGDGGVGILLPSCKNDDEDDSGLDQSCARFHDDDDEKLFVNGVTKTTELCFLDDGLDWTPMRLAGDRDHLLNRFSRRRRSSQPDYHDQCGSSLDLSPSDSCGSGGTFLWDEEVEPLGGTVPVHHQPSVRTSGPVHNNFHRVHPEPDLDRDRSSSLHIGSLHSDVSSVDVLNDLESCDLDDDDLMLDVDFPEDGSLTSDADGASHMAEWRKRQLCWGTQDVHNDTESDFQTYKLSEDQKNQRKDSQLSLDLCLNSLKHSPGPGLGLDVEELAEDCSAVRSQLEYLQKILLQDDDADEDTLTTDTLSPESTDSSSDGTETQVEVLLQEVLQLREELRSRDRTIAQLSQQLSIPVVTSRCHCQDLELKADGQTQTSETQTESVESQTPWNDDTAQKPTSALLQSDPSDKEPLRSLDNKPCSVLSKSTSAAVAPPPKPASTNPLNLDHVTEPTEGPGKRRGRSLQLPQPSKLRLFIFPSHTPSSSPTPNRKPSENNSPGSRIKAFSAASSSRLPKPKTH